MQEKEKELRNNKKKKIDNPNLYLTPLKIRISVKGWCGRAIWWAVSFFSLHCLMRKKEKELRNNKKELKILIENSNLHFPPSKLKSRIIFQSSLSDAEKEKRIT